LEQLLGRLLDLLLLPLRHLLRLKVLLPPLLPLLLLHLTDLQLQRSLLLHQHALLFLQLAKIALQLAMGLVSRVEHWTLWRVPWWAWLLCIVPEAVLLVPLPIPARAGGTWAIASRPSAAFAPP